MESKTRRCECFDTRLTRRAFIGRASCVLGAALAASGIPLKAAFAPPESMRASSDRGSEKLYPLPAEDGVRIDSDNEVILVRASDRIYAFALTCPHENAALRWRPQDRQFRCPKHENKYGPDGTFLKGRATRNMDRFALRMDDGQVIVNLDKLFRSDAQRAEWDAAVIAL